MATQSLPRAPGRNSASAHRVSSEDPPVYRARPDYSEDGAARLRAYLARMQPDPDNDMAPAVQRAYERGRGLIERLALSAQGEDMPGLGLTGLECADVLCFISQSQPIDPKNWWREPRREPSHIVGFMLIVDALEASLRATGRRS